MRFFDAEPQIIKDLKDESEIIAKKDHRWFVVTAVRHATMGKLVIVEGKEGDGVIVETEI